MRLTRSDVRRGAMRGQRETMIALRYLYMGRIHIFVQTFMESTLANQIARELFMNNPFRFPQLIY